MADLSHIQRIREQLPATSSNIYLNTGTFGPLPTLCIQAVQDHFERELREGRIGTKSFENTGNTYKRARQNIARLLNADEEEIALTDNTGEGLNIVANGINWKAGDEVITTDHEHISALAPLYQLRDRYGITIRFAELGLHADRPVDEAIAPLINEHTRLILISHVTWTTGAVLNVRAVNRLGHEHNIPVLIDGAQSAGAIPLDMQELEADFYAIPMQKWLCGPEGTGGLFASREALKHITSTYVGYWSAKNFHGDWALIESAQRFELGGRQTAAISGQSASLEWFEKEVGHQWMFERISQLNIYASQALQSIPGLILLTPTPGASGLLSFTIEGKSDEEIVTALRERNILIRNIPETRSLRISTGFYNTEEEIDTLVKALQEL
ncbi:cysteine desulfurase [Ktedonobacter sp. SOSP1-85]|uniref:aminotransferase class V-fold PLP-dependent enzyme n=1 Tax=Ktedonobacter sp. SOSP1-85 TaxID=2778367 RepID=UPI00191544F5|nr:aminotransferase class V-fold PLP-dependent enzyme [Ktedonobacter sp. SOSP1-85]GHO77604.1 cysteine desulfurase [Ktedonobacter sp. SOSP1-85]